MQTEQQIGRHTVRVEGVIIFVRHVGDYRLSEAKQVTALITDIHGRLMKAYLLVDLKEMGEVEPAARDLITAWFQDTKFEAVLLCGASFSTRLVARMVAAAVKVMRRMEIPLIFVSSEKLGRALIADHHRANSRI